MSKRKQREAELSRADTLRRDPRLGVPRGTAAILARLPSGSSLLQYHVTKAGAWLVRLDGKTKSIAVHELRWPGGKAITPETLGKAVDGFLDKIVVARGATRGRSAKREASDHATLGRRLFQALMPEVIFEKYGKDDAVYLAPHGALRRLPFEALVVASKPGLTYWLDRGPAVAYVPSASALLWCLERRKEQQQGERAAIDVVALGDPVFELPRLAHSGREVAGIRAAFGDGAKQAPTTAQIAAWHSGTAPLPRVVSLVRGQATLANLARFATRARILHIATHQLAGKDAMGQPFNRLALTGSHLGLQDMIAGCSHRLDACELVVLSACDTHRSEVATRVQDREGVMALPWGIHFAGCPAVIASLWQVEDASTAELMQTFYQRLSAGKEKDRLRAFTAARRQHRSKNLDPGHWAPFLFLGAHGR